MLPPKRPLWERLWAGVKILGQWLAIHSWQVGGLTFITLLLLVFRKRALDWTLTLVWHWLPARSWRNRTLQTLRLLERRARWAGLPRPSYVTLFQWYDQDVSNESDESRQCLISWIRIVEWALYAPQEMEKPLPRPEPEILDVCRSMVQQWNVRKLRNRKVTTIVS